MDARAFAGNFLFSLGPNTEVGGERNTACHIDIPLRHCTVQLDDTRWSRMAAWWTGLGRSSNERRGCLWPARASAALVARWPLCPADRFRQRTADPAGFGGGNIGPAIARSRDLLLWPARALAGGAHPDRVCR
jgi:hypothetical protein